MKIIFTFGIILFLSVFNFAYGQSIDERLLVKYSSEELNVLKHDQPSEYKYLTYCLDHAWYLTNIPTEKAKENNGRIGSISIKDIDQINFFALQIEIIKDDYQFFAVEGTDKMLVVKSEDHIRKELK